MTNYQSNQYNKSQNQKKLYNNTTHQNPNNDISKNFSKEDYTITEIGNRLNDKLDQALKSFDQIEQSLNETIDILSQFINLFKPVNKTDLINSYSEIINTQIIDDSPVDKEDISDNTSL